MSLGQLVKMQGREALYLAQATVQKSSFGLSVVDIALA